MILPPDSSHQETPFFRVFLALDGADSRVPFEVQPPAHLQVQADAIAWFNALDPGLYPQGSELTLVAHDDLDNPVARRTV